MKKGNQYKGMAPMVVLAFALMFAPVIGVASEANATDFPIWRGNPSRDGVVKHCPPLLDKWPEGGPKILWESEVIPGVKFGHNESKSMGGCGSVVVSGDRAIFFAHCKFPRKDVKAAFTTEMLVRIGWVEGIPDALVERINDAYKAIPRHEFKEPKRSEHINKLMETLKEDEKKKYGDLIQKSFHSKRGYQSIRGKKETFGWNLLYTLSKVRDKEFNSTREWRKATGFSFGGHGNGRILIPIWSDRYNKYSDTVICLDTATGKTVWKKSFPGYTTPSGNVDVGNSSTPAVSGDRCFVMGSNGLYCLSVKDGSLIWQAEALFSNSSPLVLGNSVIVCLPDGMTAYDAKDGRLIWKQPKVRSMFTSPALWNKAGKDYLISNSPPLKPRRRSSDIVCVDSTNGSVLWRLPVSGSGSFSTPAIGNDIAVFYREVVTAIKLSPKKGETLWKGKARCGGRGASPIIYQGHVYTTGIGYRKGHTACYELKSGDVKWDATKAVNNECGSGIVADGKVITGAGNSKIRDMQLVMYKAAPDKFENIGEIRFKRVEKQRCLSMNHTTPTVVGGKLFVRLWNRVVCYDIKK